MALLQCTSPLGKTDILTTALTCPDTMHLTMHHDDREAQLEGKPSDMVRAQRVAAKLKEVEELSTILEQARNRYHNLDEYHLSLEVTKEQSPCSNKSVEGLLLCLSCHICHLLSNATEGRTQCTGRWTADKQCTGKEVSRAKAAGENSYGQVDN